ncbi:hypothetical protein TrLO_g10351 [Triparma laevis f. longispina]|uniref:DUF6816 domain-containing protein n=1 Tax=Triparma laevis f. longispina TaxID=1714387 RepID=A0A9W7DLY9_9STRA|nr:hypothetical protein TrLO_g10351 [Triparma laevis f. longispina]
MLFLSFLCGVGSYNPSNWRPPRAFLRRRSILATPSLVLYPQACNAAADTLRDILAARDASLLRKTFLNIPPAQQEFPPWLEGTWTCTEDFAGFEFPSKKVPKENIIAQTLPGFVKLSIARFADIGRKNTNYNMTFFKDKSKKIREDYTHNLSSSISAHTDGKELVETVDYDPTKNPNRMTLKLRAGSRNGERLEIFVNSRRSEILKEDIFLSTELIRQVTLGNPTLQEPLVPRMIVGEYQHFWTYRKTEINGVIGFRANCLTAVYADAQSNAAVFNEVVGDPVIVYSHNILGTKNN